MASINGFWILLILHSLAVAQKVGLHSELGFACWNAAFRYDFDCPIELPYNKRCASEPFLATVFECINSYGTCAGKVDAAYAFVHDQCYYWGNATISTEDMKQIYLINVPNIQTEDQIANHSPLDMPVHVPFPLFSQQLTAAKETARHYTLGDQFGLSMIIYWSVITGIATIVNMWKLVDHEYLNSLFGRHLTGWFRYWFTLPALFGTKHYVPHRFLGLFPVNAPSRGQACIILGFVVINIVSLCTFIPTSTLKPLIFVENSHKIARYLANRCGIIAIKILPITILFACRNNPLIVLTGWGYQTFQLYHRWCARMMALHVILHGILLTWYSCREHIAIFKWTHIFNWAAGNTAVYCMIMMIAVSIKAVRRKFYELFLCTHQVLFFITLVAICVHISDYGWRESLLVSIAFYFTEYACRFYKVFRSGGIQTATFEIVTDDVYRVTISNPKRWKFSQGQYVYLRVLTSGNFFQAHPFSVMSETQAGLELMIKAKSGFTGAILTQLRETPENVFSKKILIEGPYGQGANLRNYNSLVILAGGVGITALYAYATSKSRDTCQKLSLVWVVKSKGLLRAYRHQLEQLMQLQDGVEIRVYVTSQQLEDTNSSLEDACSAEEDIETKEATIASILRSGRPPLAQILTSHFEKTQSTTTAVCACGPPSFLDNTRAAIRDCVRNANGVIEYLEEGLGW